jgi:hypothetical protein
MTLARQSLRCISFSDSAAGSEQQKLGRKELSAELMRASAALRLVEAADRFLKSGDDRALEALGFSSGHIADMRSGVRGPCAGYPPYAIRSIRSTVRWLEAALVSQEP